MNKKAILAVLVVALVGIGALVVRLGADTGWDMATRIERGTYGSMSKVTADTTKGTAIFSATRSRPDGFCRNVSSYTIYIGTSPTTRTSLHENEAYGLPVYSKEIFKLDGQFTGAIYATCESAASSCELRCLSALTYDNR